MCENSLSTVTQLISAYAPLVAMTIPIIYTSIKYKKLLSARMLWALAIGLVLGILVTIVIKLVLPTLCIEYPKEIIAV